MKQTFSRLLLILLFVFGILQPLFSLVRILLYGGLFEYNFTYLRAAEAMLNDKSVYSFGDINYPPVALFLFIPFRFPSVFWGQIVWSVISLSCLFLALYFSFEILDISLDWNNLGLIFPLTLLAFPTKWTLGLGQVNTFILLLIVLGFFFYRKSKLELSGLSLGIASCLKIIPGALLLYFLAKKKLKIFVCGMMTIIILFLLSGFVFGFNLVGEYFLKVLPAILGIAGKYTYYNQAASGFFSRAINNDKYAMVATTVFSFLILASMLYLWLQQKEADSLGYSLTICTMLLVSFFSWQHYFVWLLFPFLAIFARLSKIKNQGLITLLLIIIYCLVSYNIKNFELIGASFLGKILLSHVFLGNLLLWWLLVFLIRRKSEKVLH